MEDYDSEFKFRFAFAEFSTAIGALYYVCQPFHLLYLKHLRIMRDRRSNNSDILKSFQWNLLGSII